MWELIDICQNYFKIDSSPKTLDQIFSTTEPERAAEAREARRSGELQSNYEFWNSFDRKICKKKTYWKFTHIFEPPKKCKMQILDGY